MRELSRRTVLQWVGGAGAAAFVDLRLLAPIPSAAALGVPSGTYRLVRAADQLDLRVELFDATLAGGIVSPNGAAPLIRLTFGSQHTAERGFTGTNPSIPTTAITSLSAGPCVIVAPFAAPFTFSLAGLLGVLDGAAGLTGRTTAGAPTGDITALEIPAGLMLSPATGTRLRAPATALTVGDVSEIWTARLENSSGAPVDVYAIQNLSTVNLLTSRVPDAAARAAIVTNSTTIAPIKARRMWLTSSGAFARMRADWPTASLSRYRHDVTSGRDLVAQTVTSGYLLPFGHRATISVIAERTFTTDAGSGQVSVMHLTRYLDIVEPSVLNPRTYDPNAGRGLPFTRIDGVTSESTTITLATVNDTGGAAIAGVNDIRVESTGADLPVTYTAIDRLGASHTFTLPATFIADSNAYQTGSTQSPRKLIAAMNAPSRVPRLTVPFNGRPLAFADPVVPGDASQVAKPTQTLVLAMARPIASATPAQLTTALMPGLVCALGSATVVDDTVSALSGTAGAPVSVTHHNRWLNHGNGASNFDLSFLKLGVPSVGSIGAGQAVEAVASLELSAEVFNQAGGVGLDLPTVNSPWDPAVGLGAGAKIFGSITLADIIEAVGFDLNQVGLSIPGAKVTVSGNIITVEFTYKPNLKSAPNLGFIATPQTRACVIVTTTSSLDDLTDPTVRTEMTVSDFIFQVPPTAPAIELDMAKVSAIIETGKPLDVITDVRGWSFSGALSFLADLADLFSSMGIGIDLTISSDEIELGGSAGLPSFNLGVVRVSNINAYLGITLPLSGGPVEVTAGIGTKADPVDVSVAMFGGTFWIGIGLAFGDVPNAVSHVGIGISIYWEALDFDIIIAKANVTLMLSASFELDNGDITFTGAVSLIGEIEVIGLGSASAGIVASLTYLESAQTIVLKGTVVYEVDSIFGSTSGDVAIGRHEFPVGNGAAAAAIAAPAEGARRAAAPAAAAGDAAEPAAAAAAPPVAFGAAGPSSFGNHYSQAQWSAYCDAFA